MRVLVSDIIAKKDKDGSDYYWVVGSLQSGMEIIIDDYYYDLNEYIGHHVEMLISIMRSPYCELQRGIQNHIFLPSKYYSVELIDELLRKKGVVSTGNKRVIVLNGELIDSYNIPEKWVPLTQRKLFQLLYKEPAALKTEDGTFLLYPYHLRKRVLNEKIIQDVIIAGGLSLEAWTPSQ